jgi:hypothetical protein
LNKEADVSDIISSDHPLTENQQVLLSALLDTLVPASDDGALPSAAEVDFDAYLRTQAEDFIAELIEILGQFEPAFADLPLAARCEVVATFSAEHRATFKSLLARVYGCYYQNDQVRERIGVVTGAPFPQGNEVMPGDLSLLDPVIENSSRHRFRTE